MCFIVLQACCGFTDTRVNTAVSLSFRPVLVLQTLVQTLLLL